MLDPIVFVALASLAGPALVLAPVPTVVAALLVSFIFVRRMRRPVVTAIVGALSLFVGALRASYELAEADALHARVVSVLPKPLRCEGEARVLSSPIVIGRASHSADEPASSARVDVELRTGSCEGRVLAEPLRARLYGVREDVRRGDRLFVAADLAPVHLFKNRELPDVRPSLARSGVAASGGAQAVEILDRSWSLGALVDRARTAVRKRIEATYHPDAAPLGRALVLGETDLDPTTDQAFRESGLSHLLAVSGTHLVIAVLGILGALRAVLVRIRVVAERTDIGRFVALVGIPIAWLYADFAGGSGSAIRASAMLTAGLLARVIGRHAPVARTFACSLLVLALLDPLVACDISFALSTAATAGLVVLQRPIASIVVRGPSILKPILEPVATTLAATLGCTPLLATISPSLPALGILANLVAAPLGELAALPICLFHAVLGFAPPVERGAALLGSGALLAVSAIARFTTKTGLVVPVPPPTAAALAMLAIFAALAFAAKTRSGRVVAACAVAMGLFVGERMAERDGAPKDLLRITVLDVGQGDSILVDLPDGSAMLVDGGGMVGSPIDLGARVVQPVLRGRRRSSLAIMVLSHAHPDHLGGLVSTLSRVGVGELWDTGQGEGRAGPAYEVFLAEAKKRGIPRRGPRDLCGAPRSFGGATIEVIAPCPTYSPDASTNDTSLVLRIVYGQRSALLVGDAEHDEEHRLLGSEAHRLRADFLKVGHHGSRTSTSPAFLDAVRPSLAAISSGVRNRFGHPHPTTLGALASRGIAIVRTDRGGAIVWETDGSGVRVSRP